MQNWAIFLIIGLDLAFLDILKIITSHLPLVMSMKKIHFKGELILREINNKTHPTVATISSSAKAPAEQVGNDDQQKVVSTATTPAPLAVITHKDKMITDATAALQYITNPTGLKPLNAFTEKSGALVDIH